MEIRILVRTTEPLTGTAMAEGEEPLNFEGWLELLSALSRLTGEGRYSAAGKPGSLTRPDTQERRERWPRK